MKSDWTKNKDGTFNFKSYSYVGAGGNARTPARFWYVALMTELEYKDIADIENGYHKITEKDMWLINLNFGDKTHNCYIDIDSLEYAT